MKKKTQLYFPESNKKLKQKATTDIFLRLKLKLIIDQLNFKPSDTHRPATLFERTDVGFIMEECHFKSSSRRAAETEVWMWISDFQLLSDEQQYFLIKPRFWLSNRF